MLTRDTSRVMRVLSAESGGAALSLFFAGWLDWPETRSENAPSVMRQAVTTRYNFFMCGETIIGRGGRRTVAFRRFRGEPLGHFACNVDPVVTWCHIR